MVDDAGRWRLMQAMTDTASRVQLGSQDDPIVFGSDGLPYRPVQADLPSLSDLASFAPAGRVAMGARAAWGALSRELARGPPPLLPRIDPDATLMGNLAQVPRHLGWYGVPTAAAGGLGHGAAQVGRRMLDGESFSDAMGGMFSEDRLVRAWRDRWGSQNGLTGPERR